jgi:hypothetical protein
MRQLPSELEPHELSDEPEPESHEPDEPEESFG